MGGGILGLGVMEAPELFGSLGFLEPIGHDTALRKLQLPDITSRKRSFKREFAKVVFGPYPGTNPNELLRAGISIGGQLIEDLFPHIEGRFDNKIHLTVTLDAAPSVIRHAEAGNTVVYVLGMRDPLVIPERIIKSLEIHSNSDPCDEAGNTKISDQIILEITNNKHAYMGWRTGKDHIARALSHIK